MPRFSKNSRFQLSTCVQVLRRLFFRVVEKYDCTIIQGHRNQSEQDGYYLSGRSRVRFPHSSHNRVPSEAVDAAPYIGGIPWPKAPSNWNNRNDRNRYIKDVCQFYHFAGFVEGMAVTDGVSIRWGGDWDRDHDLADQSFDDLVHFELK